MKYQPRAPEIDAVQWRGDNQDEVRALIGNAPAQLDRDTIEVRDGLLVEMLDWIVKGDEGEFIVISNVEFCRNYEPCDKGLVAAGGME